jgi:hypothetical protein
VVTGKKPIESAVRARRCADGPWPSNLVRIICAYCVSDPVIIKKFFCYINPEIPNVAYVSVE